MKKMFVFVILVMLLLSSCDNPSNVMNPSIDINTFDKLIIDAKRYEEEKTKWYKESIEEDIIEEIKAILSNAYLYNEGFFNEYYKNHSPEDYLKVMCLIGCFYKHDSYAADYYLMYENFNLYSKDTFVSLSYDTVINDNGTWYKDHPGDSPNEEKSTTTGKFNREDGTIYSASRDNTITVEYYGDFAIAHVERYDYDQGVYEWIDGTFYDEPASFIFKSFDELWYKGCQISHTFDKNFSSSIYYDEKNEQLYKAVGTDKAEDFYIIDIDRPD